MTEISPDSDGQQVGEPWLESRGQGQQVGEPWLGSRGQGQQAGGTGLESNGNGQSQGTQQVGEPSLDVADGLFSCFTSSKAEKHSDDSQVGASHSNRQTHNGKDRTDNSRITTANIQNSTGAGPTPAASVPVYPFHNRGDKKTGLCLVFALFTESLPGYREDERILLSTFKRLDYEIKLYNNLTQKQLLDALTKHRDDIAKQPEKPYDRLVVVILSHGKENGLLTCADDKGIKTECVRDGNGQETYLITNISSIINVFKHDTTLNLKDVPKLFLIQACRGDETLKAASRPRSTYHHKGVSLPVPVVADFLIAYATVHSHPSFVSPTDGSWFIQTFLKYVQKYHHQLHAVDIFTLVNAEVASKQGQVVDNPTPVVQMPIFTSTLRKHFYLSKQLNSKPAYI